MTAVQIILGIVGLIVVIKIASSIAYSKGKNAGGADGFQKGKLFGLDQGYNMGFNEGRANARLEVAVKTVKPKSKKK